MSAGVKLSIAAVLVAAAIGYLAFLGGANTWQYYLSVDEAVSDAAQLTGNRIRVSGRVETGSLKTAADRRQAEFELVGDSHKLHAECHCALPDNLAENIDVVVEGTLHDNGILGRKVITRCASKYQQTNAAAGARLTRSVPKADSDEPLSGALSQINR